MFKLFILAALVAFAAARPGYLEGSALEYSVPHTTYVEEPTYAKVGSIVKTIPTAVSHQSISQVHSSGHYIQPVVAPVYKTYAAPSVHSYGASPLVKTIATPYTHSYAGAPLVGSAYSTYDASPVLKSYAPTYGGHYGSHYGSHYGGDYYGHGAW